MPKALMSKIMWIKLGQVTYEVQSRWPLCIASGHWQGYHAPLHLGTWYSEMGPVIEGLIRLTLMPRAHPLLKQAANLIRIQLHHVFPKVHRIVASIPGGICRLIDMSTGDKHAAIGPSSESKVVKLCSHKMSVVETYCAVPCLPLY
jgi:hypothetical protein